MMRVETILIRLMLWRGRLIALNIMLERLRSSGRARVYIHRFDELKQEYEEKFKEYTDKITKQLMGDGISRKGKMKVLKELKDTMNDSIRILKCVVYEDKIWFLIEENLEVEEDPQQYWIQDIDLTPEEKEYINEYVPSTLLEEGAEEDRNLNKTLKTYHEEIDKLKRERTELLKECREIRFGLKVTYFCMDEEFDEEVEQKLYQYDIQIVDYEDEIKNLSENLHEYKLTVNNLTIKNNGLLKRVEELNSIMKNISLKNEDGSNEQKITEELIEKNKKLAEELDERNEEIESLKNSSIIGKEGFLSHREDHSSREAEQSKEASYKEFDANDFDLKDLSEPRSGEIRLENELLRRKLKNMETELMDVQNRSNIIISQNQKLKHEINELEGKIVNRLSLGSDSDKAGAGVKDIEHLKDILIKFLKRTPLTEKSNEQLLLIVYSMLYIHKPTMDEIQQERKILTANYEEDIAKRNKKPMFGGLFSRSKSRKR